MQRASRMCMVVKLWECDTFLLFGSQKVTKGRLCYTLESYEMWSDMIHSKNFKYFYISGREALLLVEEYREKVYYTEIV